MWLINVVDDPGVGGMGDDGNVIFPDRTHVAKNFPANPVRKTAPVAHGYRPAPDVALRGSQGARNGLPGPHPAVKEVDKGG